MNKGFTLAEVLITLAIIGIVAALTIPSLVLRNQQKGWDTSASVFNRKLGEALKIMNLESTLAGQRTTENFVKELSKHIKITKTCNNTELEKCFASEFTVAGENKPIKVSDIKFAKNLNSAKDYGTNVMGLQFANGITALVAYNPDCKQDPYDNNNIVSISGDKNRISLGTDALSILYDVSGSSTPNNFSGGTKDMRGINVAIQTPGYLFIGMDYTGVQCNDTSAEGYEYCGTLTNTDALSYWAGAQKACADIGMRVATSREVKDLLSTEKLEEEIIPEEEVIDIWLSSGVPQHAPFGRGGQASGEEAATQTAKYNTICIK